MASLGDLVLQGGVSPQIQGANPTLQGGTYNPSTPATQSIAVPTAQGSANVITPAGVPNPTITNSTGLDGTSLTVPEYIKGINTEYGAQINAGPQNLALLQQANQVAQTGVNTNTAAQEATYGTQANAQNASLQNAIGSQQNQQQLSLAELADQIRGQNQGLQAQLGAVGAGSSSATGAGQQALAHEQNTQTANIDQQANANISGAQTQEAGVNAVLKANDTALETAKQNQIAQITTNYATLMKQLQTALLTASGEEQTRLAEYGQSLTSAASTQLANLDQVNSNIQNNVNGLMTQGVQTAQGLQDIPTAQAVNPITTQPLSPFTPGGTTGNATASPTGGSLSTLLQQNQ